MNLAFETAAPKDIALIQGLAHRIWHLHYPGIISVEQINYMLPRMYATEQIAADLSDPASRYELVLLDETPIGFALYRLESEHVFLSKLYILPEMHGKGIGKLALERIAQFGRANGATSIDLFVNKRNEKAIRAYERFGFDIAESVVNEFGGGFVMDDYKMRYRLRS